MRIPTAASRRSAVTRAALALTITAVATSCMIANPSRTVPASSGAALKPWAADVPYLPEAAPGCEGPGSDVTCGGSQTLDVFRARDKSKGTIVFFHGGGFNYGDKTDREELGPFLRQTHLGWDVVTVNYRLSGPADNTNMFPTAIEDAVAAIKYLRAQRQQLGINTDRIVTAGHSAGGTIAALLGTAWNSKVPELQGAGRISGYVPIAGIHDFRLPGGNWGGTWTTSKDQDRLASPVTWIDRDDPPAYVIHGDRDFIVSVAQSRRLKQVADDRGFGGNVRLDVVDLNAKNKPLPVSVRAHSPVGGSNADELDLWFREL